MNYYCQLSIFEKTEKLTELEEIDFRLKLALNGLHLGNEIVTCHNNQTSEECKMTMPATNIGKLRHIESV